MGKSGKKGSRWGFKEDRRTIAKDKGEEKGKISVPHWNP
jgi:hypothetical protein